MPPNIQTNGSGGIDIETSNFINGTRGIDSHTSFRPITIKKIETIDEEEEEQAVQRTTKYHSHSNFKIARALDPKAESYVS
jgi:hypothetical protein